MIREHLRLMGVPFIDNNLLIVCVRKARLILINQFQSLRALDQPLASYISNEQPFVIARNESVEAISIAHKLRDLLRPSMAFALWAHLYASISAVLQKWSFASLAMTENGSRGSKQSLFCHFITGDRAKKSSHISSYKSRQDIFMLFTSSFFLCLDPAFICFSLVIALYASSHTS